MWINEYIDRREVVDTLTSIRKEWEEATDGEDLLVIKGNVGLILVDVAEALELIGDEINAVIGQPMLKEAQGLLIIDV